MASANVLPATRGRVGGEASAILAARERAAQIPERTVVIGRSTSARPRTDALAISVFR